MTLDTCKCRVSGRALLLTQSRSDGLLKSSIDVIAAVQTSKEKVSSSYWRLCLLLGLVASVWPNLLIWRSPEFSVILVQSTGKDFEF